ncbi:S-adenosyl-L-methionine-dependent methyltransferase [Xylariaceae sp. FL1651]|nr:S-adenosyl-L-methionine-dependent methyltransferase [Xylariaceae sp. FL1651]
MPSKLAELRDTLGGINAEDLEATETERLQLIAASKKLLSLLETKEEKIYDITFSQPIVFAALQACLDLGLWEEWTAINGQVKSVDELCKLCKHRCEPNLLRRLLRLLASVHIIKEAREDHYELTPFSLSFGNKQSGMSQCIQCRTHHWQYGCVNLPLFLAKTGYKEPQDARNSNYADWCPEKLDFFGKCVAEPAYQDSFSGFMKTWAKYKVPWPQFYDTESLVSGADLENGGVLCVDIGGHHGIDLTRLLDKHPDVPAGSLVLQDMPEVLSGAKDLSDKIKVMPHDMFQPQPVIASRAYYFHAVFHDWPDTTALQVLKNTAEAMKKGYSKLLIVDIVLPPVGATAIQAAMDVQMMAIVSAYERTEAMWNNLMNSAGLKIIKIWEDGHGNESLVEAELA